MKMYRFNLYFYLVIILLSVAGCTQKGDRNNYLKVYSPKVYQNGDSTYRKIPAFAFKNQRNETITNQQVENKVYVADFFFTSCPTICPRMKSQMLRIFEKYGNNKNFLILSHSIDPEYDTVEVLADFSKKLDAYQGNWHFLTGDKQEIYDLAEHYMVTADEDENAPGGFIHSGAFILVDKNGLIRGFYDGTDEVKVTQLIEDITLLLNESK